MGSAPPRPFLPLPVGWWEKVFLLHLNVLQQPGPHILEPPRARTWGGPGGTCGLSGFEVFLFCSLSIITVPFILASTKQSLALANKLRAWRLKTYSILVSRNFIQRETDLQKARGDTVSWVQVQRIKTGKGRSGRVPRSFRAMVRRPLEPEETEMSGEASSEVWEASHGHCQCGSCCGPRLPLGPDRSHLGGEMESTPHLQHNSTWASQLPGFG